MVGVLRVAKSGFLSDLNNLSVFPMFKERYKDKFGFTQAETSAITAYLHVTHSVDDIKGWYNSYSAGSDVSLYNPWSIVSLCDQKLLNSYWVETGTPLIYFLYYFRFFNVYF